MQTPHGSTKLEQGALMREYQTSVMVEFLRFYLVNSPQSLRDDPGNYDFAEGEIALSARDGIGLRSVWSNHKAHITVRVHDTPDDAPPPPGIPLYSFHVDEPELTVMTVMGTPELIFPAPPPGPVAVGVECTGREEAYRLLLVEHRENVVDVERWTLTIWPQSASISPGS
jgi:hypothetical protein